MQNSLNEIDRRIVICTYVLYFDQFLLEYQIEFDRRNLIKEKKN